jgi:hypothetical protein
MRTAHYTATKARKFVTIAEGVQPLHDATIKIVNVDGKKAARMVASTYNAKPWNF